MDVRNAAFGLNLGSASRIYFVNPVCRPNIEAQAIKRAHRIGQTRPVYVETLVLKGTIEEKMLERSKRMTRSEHLSANHLEDDVGIRQIIQSARVLPISDDERAGRGQMASLEVPQQLWGREGFEEASHPVDLGEAQSGTKRKRRASSDEKDRNVHGEVDDSKIDAVARRRLSFMGVDVEPDQVMPTSHHEPQHALHTYSPEDNQPQAAVWSSMSTAQNHTSTATHHGRRQTLDEDSSSKLGHEHRTGNESLLVRILEAL